MEPSRTRMLNALTVDVEDYFHTEAMSAAVRRQDWDRMPSRVQVNTHRVFELLARHNVRATFFFLGWVAERFPGLVVEAARLGHEIGCHSYWHRPVYRLSPAEFRQDTKRAKAVIEEAAGVQVRGYRAPSFSLVLGTEWAAEILAELGFAYDSSVHPIRHDLYSNPQAPRFLHWIANGTLLELPVATAALYGHTLPLGGGGYLRVFPYPYLRWGLRQINETEHNPAIVYVHPWEFDPNQPRLAVSLKSRLRQYTNLKGTARKMARLLADFDFGTIGEAFSGTITS
ncbi:MAG: XrtA system polysaccharide deacetylase, partial [Terriglobia bacterium]